MSRILVIDDSDLVRQLILEALAIEGFETDSAADANSGYQKALEQTPDLIVLDVHLPDVTGYELCRVFRNRSELSKIPILMVTGAARQAADKSRALEMGANDYLLKPFENAELVRRIRMMLAGQQAGDAPKVPVMNPPLAPSLPIASTPPAVRGTPSPTPGKAPIVQQEQVPSTSATPPNDPPVSPDPRSTHSAPLAVPMSFRHQAWVLDLLFSPDRIQLDRIFPRLSVTYVGLALGFSLIGVALTAGPSIKPVLAALWIGGTWGLAVAALIMSTSIMGLHMRWREGAKVISLAGLPILAKMASGALLSALTSLSPFYFTASPVLIWPSAPWIFERLDVFELWSLWLLWTLFDKVPESSKKQRRVAVILVWGMCIAMTGVLARLLEPAIP